MLVAQTLEYPFGRVLLLARRLAVGRQDCVNNRQQRPELRLGRSLCQAVFLRCRIQARLADRIAVQPEHLSCFPATRAT